MSRGLLCPGLVQPERRLPEMSFKCHMRKRRPAHFPSDKSHRYPNYVLYLCVCVCVCVHTPHTHSYKGHGYPMNECMCSCPRSMCIHEVAPRHTYARHTYLRVCILIVHTHTHTHTHIHTHEHTHTHERARTRTRTHTHTGEIELAGLPEEGGEDAVRQALADLLGVDVSQIVLPEQTRRRQRRAAARTIKFEIIGDSTKATELAADLKTGNLAAKLSSQLSQTYKMNITAEVSGGDVAETSDKRPEGEAWEQVDGQYVLRKCPQGFLLVNTTVELSLCRECDAGTYSFGFSDGCKQHVYPTVCDTRDCTACPAGAICAKGSDEAAMHFVPKAVKVNVICEHTLCQRCFLVLQRVYVVPWCHTN